MFGVLFAVDVFGLLFSVCVHIWFAVFLRVFDSVCLMFLVCVCCFDAVLCLYAFLHAFDPVLVRVLCFGCLFGVFDAFDVYVYDVVVCVCLCV